MFFSRINLSKDAAGSSRYWSTFRSAYSLHQAIWELFADHPDRERDFLYHVKEEAKLPEVFTLSARPAEDKSGLWQVESKEFAPMLSEGIRLGFLLRANPVRTREGKRHDVVMEEKKRLQAQGIPRDQWPLEAELVQESGEKWLKDRSEKAGFRLLMVRADGYRQHEFSKAKGGHPVRFSTIDFNGVLEVSDPCLFFQDALCKGLGPAKGLGCGMMLVRRMG